MHGLPVRDSKPHGDSYQHSHDKFNDYQSFQDQGHLQSHVQPQVQQPPPQQPQQWETRSRNELPYMPGMTDYTEYNKSDHNNTDFGSKNFNGDNFAKQDFGKAFQETNVRPNLDLESLQ